MSEVHTPNQTPLSKSRKNPYARPLKRQVTIRLDVASVDYFKKIAADLGMPYQTSSTSSSATAPHKSAAP